MRLSGDGEDHTGEFTAGDPGEGGLVLVFAADLEEVEEVGAAGADLDEVFGGVGEGGWEGGDRQVEGAGDVVGYLDGFHGCGCGWETSRTEVGGGESESAADGRGLCSVGGFGVSGEMSR